MRSKSILVMAAVLLQVYFASVSSAIEPSFQGLGFLPGYDNSSVSGVSGDGRFIVGECDAGVAVGFRWDKQNGFLNLGDLPGGSSTTHPASVSHDGSVVTGWSSGELPGSGSNVRPFRWTQQEGMKNLDIPLNGRGDGAGMGVSADGTTIVGFCYLNEGNSLRKSFRWTESEGTVFLGDMVGGDGFSCARATSADGTYIVGETNTQATGIVTNRFDEFLWSQSEGMKLLGVLPGESLIRSTARAISYDGQAITGFAYISNGMERAFRWAPEEGMMPLEQLTDGRTPRYGFAISGDGCVIGGGSSGLEAAYIWDTENGSRDLKFLLEQEFGFDLTDWRLTLVTGLSYDGLIIVGNGVNPFGQEEAWVVTLPEPTTLLLLGLGAVMLRRKR